MVSDWRVGDHSKNANPAKKPAATTPRPYAWPTLMANPLAPLVPPPLPAVWVAAAPPKPVVTVSPEPAVESPVAVADMVGDEVDVFTRVGSCAPHGFFVRQSL